MRDIATAAGVSVATVSLALKNHPRISISTRDRIHSLAAKLGYKPDPIITKFMEHLRVERSQRSTVKLAVLIPELTKKNLSSYHPLSENLRGMHEQAELSGFELELFYLKTIGASLERIRGILLARGITGIIVAPFKSGVGKYDMNFKGMSVVTAGYSVTNPNFNRACPNYLAMMDELLEHLCELGHQRIGFIMTYHQGGIGHKLFSSSFLFYQSKIELKNQIPILRRRDISDRGICEWMEKFKPSVVISSGEIHSQIKKLGWSVPNDVSFASLDLSELPYEATGMYHRHAEVGRETIKLLLSGLNFNQTGIPSHPKIVLVDSYLKTGNTVKRAGSAVPIQLRKTFG